MIAICWFRRDLRLTDNPAFRAAAAAGRVLPVFLVDKALRAQGAASRWRLERSLHALGADLRWRGGTLAVIEGEAAALVELARRAGATEVHATAWPDPAQRRADEVVASALAREGRRLVLHDGHTLLPPATLRTGSGGGFKVYGAFARALRRQGVPPPVSVSVRIRWAPAVDGTLALPDVALASDMRRGEAVVARFAPPAGEAAALDRLADFRDRISGYVTGRDRPDRPDATSGLSDALAVGEISARTLWAAAEAMAGDPALASAAEKFMAELIWRDFAWSLLDGFPQITERSWRADWDAFPWRKDASDLVAWQRAMTGEPLVDAGLRELYVTGRMHNRVRMVVASYLAKHLLLDWRAGLAWFADTLIDWDPASNAMNWQWVAGSGPDASPFFRIFNPAAQAEKFDPKGDYRARWLYGWRGSRSAEGRAWFEAVPRTWGLDTEAPYPDRPIVDLAAGRQRALDALQAMRAARAD
ncbi:deoxyribodipyrimidine photo-lyase [Paracoccus sp. SSK6]|uniref:cryptochrome/photolyase family protein n=1 Tax=Paracoccus sp. SSK6 TaxID=3143131 RepID=UPI00321A6119